MILAWASPFKYMYVSLLQIHNENLFPFLHNLFGFRWNFWKCPTFHLSMVLVTSNEKAMYKKRQEVSMLHEAVVLVAAVSTGVSGKDIQLSFQFIYLNTPPPPTVKA